LRSPDYFILHIVGPTSVRPIGPVPIIDLSSGRIGPRFLLARSVFGRVGPYYLNDRIGLGPVLILALARSETDFGPIRDRPGPSLVEVNEGQRNKVIRIDS
jgi:hypothetical protein